MKLFSWNVNGFRAVTSKGAFDAFLDAHSPDILCLQETKLNASIIPRPEFQMKDARYPHQFWHIAQKPGYSGTALLSKIPPLKVTYDFPTPHSSLLIPNCNEGRVITAEFEDFIIVTAYVPNSKEGLERLPYRQKWDADFRAYLASLIQPSALSLQPSPKPVYACGDFNCAHNEIDLAHPATNHMSAGFTDEEREGFSALLATGFTDTFRATNPDVAERYTWWSFRTFARERNVGWRIDYWLASSKNTWSSPQIHDDILGSDHCPVSLVI